MKYKKGDKVILKGTKSISGPWERYFKKRKKGDIVTIHEISGKTISVVNEKYPNERSGFLLEKDVCSVSWKERFKEVK